MATQAHPSRTGHFSAGRACAALWALGRLGAGEGQAPEGSGFRGKKVPVRLLREGLSGAGWHLVRAKARGAERGKAAAEIFRALPDLLPPRLPGSTMEPGEEDAFVAGYEQQLATYRDKFGALLG
ncbi:hypothetical protein ACFWNK_21495 [Streptomyces sp. NPDC058417]|uniref:hypothetical protein n=1 Tax=unclassified Streptomyces TaxID=2593676 RepID=UPI00366265A1